MRTDVYRALPIERTAGPPLSYHMSSLIFEQNIPSFPAAFDRNLWPKVQGEERENFVIVVDPSVGKTCGLD